MTIRNDYIKLMAEVAYERLRKFQREPARYGQKFKTAEARIKQWPFSALGLLPPWDKADTQQKYVLIKSISDAVRILEDSGFISWPSE